MDRLRTLTGWLLAALCGAALIGLTAGLAGCGATPQTELTAADALVQIAAVIETGVAEYHGETVARDAGRRDAVLDALASRIAREPARAAEHAAAAKAALDRVQADAAVAEQRAANMRAATAVLLEMATRLRALALDRLTMTARARDLVEPYMVARAPPTGGFAIVQDGPPAATGGP